MDSDNCGLVVFSMLKAWGMTVEESTAFAVARSTAFPRIISQAQAGHLTLMLLPWILSLGVG